MLHTIVMLFPLRRIRSNRVTLRPSGVLSLEITISESNIIPEHRTHNLHMYSYYIKRIFMQPIEKNV